MQDRETETQPRNILSSQRHWSDSVNTTMAFHAARLVRKRKSQFCVNNFYGQFEFISSNKVTEDQVEELMKAFAQADKDGDGILTVEEYKAAFHEHGVFVDEEWIRGMMKKIDLDGDGTISLTEFVEKNMKNKSIIPFDSRGLISFMSRDQKIASTLVMTDDVLQEQTQAAFRLFDKNKDGFVTRKEFQAVSRKLSTKQIEAVFLSYDSNKDDKLSYEEFKKFMFTNIEEKQKLKAKKL